VSARWKLKQKIPAETVGPPSGSLYSTGGEQHHIRQKENNTMATKNSAAIDLKNNQQQVNQEAAKGKILQAAMDHLQAIGVARTHFGLHFDLVWEE